MFLERQEKWDLIHGEGNCVAVVIHSDRKKGRIEGTIIGRWRM